MMMLTRQGRALGPVAGAVSGLMRSHSGQDQEVALNRLTATAVVTAGQLGRLNATNQQMLSVQKDIAAKQQQLVHLGQEQVQLQTAMLNVQTQQLAVQRQQLVMQQISALNLEVQTRLQQQQSIHRDRQRQLKDAAFESKQKVTSISSIPNLVERFVLLSQLAASIDQVGLAPNELEEIGDKEYTQSMIDDLSRAVSSTTSALSSEQQSDLQFFLANVGARQHLNAASAAASANIAGLSAHQAHLHREIASIDQWLSQRRFADWVDEKWPKGPGFISAKAWRTTLSVLVFSFGFGSCIAAMPEASGIHTGGAAQSILLIASIVLLLLAVTMLGFAMKNDRAMLMKKKEGLLAQLAHLDQHGAAAAQGASVTESQRIALTTTINAFIARHPGLQSFL